MVEGAALPLKAATTNGDPERPPPSLIPPEGVAFNVGHISLTFPALLFPPTNIGNASPEPRDRKRRALKSTLQEGVKLHAFLGIKVSD